MSFSAHLTWHNLPEDCDRCREAARCRENCRKLIVRALLDEWDQYRDDDWSCPKAERQERARAIADRLLGDS